MKNFKFEKKYVTYQLNSLKQKKVDPNNIVLNAAAYQDQIFQKYGMNFNKKKLKLNYQIKSKNKKDDKNEKQSLIDKIKRNKESEKEIIKRNKEFLSKLTFAEKAGIQKIKSFPLSVDQWKKLEKETIKREDFKGECPICMEKLASRESIILSCSHVFHKVCLQNFEKFSSVNKCPLCRCERYECKTYTKDKEYYVEKCVIIIQQVYRGYIVRYKLYLSVFKNNMPNNKHLRSIYSYWKIKELTKIMCDAINKQMKINQNLLEETQKKNEELIKIENKNRALLEKRNKEIGKLYTDWDGVIDKMKNRKNEVCAICFCDYGNKALYILDCSHCFHKNCLDSFERFDPYYIKRCPICRQNYKKKELKK